MFEHMAKMQESDAGMPIWSGVGFAAAGLYIAGSHPGSPLF
jgi:hypothetical protein